MNQRSFPISFLLLSALLACDPPSTTTPPGASGTPGASAAPGPTLVTASPPRVPPTPFDSAAQVPTAEPPAKDDVVRLATASNAFGFDLWCHRKAASGNQIVSPASITTALAMTWAGARGETASQMKKVLHFDGTPTETTAIAGRLLRSLEDPARPIQFRVANRLFGEKTFAFQNAFLDGTRTAFGAPLEPLDFVGAHEAARTRINQWVEAKTEKRIVDLVPTDGVTKDTRLVLVNAIYFLGDWESPFPKEGTHDEPFFVSAKEKKQAATMVQRGSFRHGVAGGATLVELPYVGEQMSMVVVVPDAVDGLGAVEASLDATTLERAVAALTEKTLVLHLPKFEVSPAAPLRLGDDLRAMGMPLAFDAAKADFTGIADPPDKADRLSIGNVFHKAFVKVDEKGTEAAAATAVSMPKGGGVPEAALELRVDRPFFFAIRDVASGLVLFMGRVVDPTPR